MQVFFGKEVCKVEDEAGRVKNAANYLDLENRN
jgi:hypothetical protein